MKKLTLIFLFITTISFSQDSILLTDGKITYRESKRKPSIPLGRNAILSYDDFFKTYTLSYTNIDGNLEEMRFIFDANGIGIGYKYNGKKYSITRYEGKNKPLGKSYVIMSGSMYGTETYVIYDFEE